MRFFFGGLGLPSCMPETTFFPGVFAPSGRNGHLAPFFGFRSLDTGFLFKLWSGIFFVLYQSVRALSFGRVKVRSRTRSQGHTLGAEK